MLCISLLSGCSPANTTTPYTIEPTIPAITETYTPTTIPITTTPATTVPPTTTAAVTPTASPTSTYILPTAIIIPYTPVSIPGYGEPLTADVKLSTKTVTLTVYAFPNETQNAKHILDLYAKALPALEDLIGVPFPQNYPIKVQEFARKDIGDMAGKNNGINGLQIADTNITYDPTLIHELSHYWFASPRYSEKWISEGFAMLYADLTLRYLGDVKAADQYKNSRIASYQRLKGTLDFPLEQWGSETGDLMTFEYGKALVFVFGLYDKAGPDAFKKVNQKVFASPNSRVNSDLLLKGLTDFTGKDFLYLGPGWIYPGTALPLK
jgi:aminopeptidase N